MPEITAAAHPIVKLAVLDRSNFYAPGELGKTRRLTPEGFLVCEGVAIARTGEQRYHKSELPLDADGAGEITVMRLPEEVFNERTIASFQGKPVTVEHPNAFVTPDSWKAHAVGTVQNVRRGAGIEDDMLIADLVITDAGAIAHVNRDRPELSCGYDSEYEQLGPGHAVQRNIIGNHVALVDRGRAGPRCSIRDGKKPGPFGALLEMIRVKDDYDPKEPRDEKGRWTAGARKAAAAKAKSGSKPESKSLGEDEPAGKYPAFVTNFLREFKTSAEADKHLKSMSSEKIHKALKQAEGYTDGAAKHVRTLLKHELKDRGEKVDNRDDAFSRMLDSIPYSTFEGLPMKFSQQFVRIMNAFKNEDAAALDRELSAHDTNDGESAYDARLKDALDWIDEQRRNAADAAARDRASKDALDAAKAVADAKAKKEKEDKEAESKDAKLTAGEPEISDLGILYTGKSLKGHKHGYTGDSLKDVFARAEILSPGISVPTSDALKNDDAIPSLMLKAVQSAYAESGKEYIEPFLMGAKIEAVTKDNVSGVFIGASELARQCNNQESRPGKLSTRDFGKAVSPATINENNRKFWANRQA